MADTGASSPGCVDRLVGYVRTQKGLILAAEMVSPPPTPKSHVGFCAWCAASPIWTQIKAASR